MTSSLGGGEEAAEAAELREMLDEASNPSTPPERLNFILDELNASGFDFKDSRLAPILGAVASHPNAPPEILVDLAGQHPEAVATNPVLPLLPLEMPDLMRRFSPWACLRLLALEYLPAPVVGAIAALPDEGIAKAARMHVALAGEAGADWQEQVSDCLRAEAKRAVSDYVLRQGLIEAVELGLLPRWAAGPEPWPGPGVPDTPDRLLRRAQGKPPVLREVRRALDPTTEPETLMEYVTRSMPSRCAPEVVMAVLLNPSASAEARYKAAFRSEGHQLLAASDPRSESELLAELAQETIYPWIRRLIWRHPNTPSEVRDSARDILWKRVLSRELASPQVSSLVVFVAMQSLLATERGKQDIAHSGDWRRRLAAALSLPASDSILLGTLSQDGNRLVRAAAHARIVGAAPLDLSE